jgi:thiamine-phosphate pyrophosphorylase
LIGVSTHSLEQARQAVVDGANYLGCGPTFPSNTKAFTSFPGVEFLRQVGSEITLPAFAIGGITLENLSQVIDAGFARVAVSSAVTRAPDPAERARQLLARLNEVAMT